MLLFFCHGKHAYTLQGWLDYYPESERGPIQIVPYQDVDPVLPHASACVFSDVERILPAWGPRLEDTWERLRDSGCRMLNHPTRSLRRYDLQQALDNKFRVFRESLPADVRFPVFLRVENDHKGSRTPLLHSIDEVRSHWEQLPGALAVEFLDTSDWRGVYRKYSVMRLGDALIPRHILFSRKWQVKNTDLSDPGKIREELDFLERFPYRDEILRAFERGGIHYGRIDYSIHRGRVQVWEINTNPMLKTEAGGRIPERTEVLKRSARQINAAFRALATA